jgi:hypothetical protein
VVEKSTLKLYNVIQTATLLGVVEVLVGTGSGNRRLSVYHHRDCHPAGRGRGSGGCQGVATEDYLFIIIEIATLLGVDKDLVTFTFDKVNEVP